MLTQWLRDRLFGRLTRTRRIQKRPGARTKNRYRFRFECLESRLAPADFLGGVQVAGGDIDGDGLAEVVTGAMAGGGPHVKVFSGATGGLLSEWMAYDGAFRGGVNVAVGRVTGGFGANVITGAGKGGGPNVRVFNGTSAELVNSFMAFDESFRGGVYVAAGDVNGDGIADIIVGKGAGDTADVRVFDGATNAQINGFIAYDAGFRGGVTVGATDINGDGRAEIITGAGPGGGPHVKVFDGLSGALISEFMAYDDGFRGGVRVAGGVGASADILTAAGPGGGPHVKVFDGASINLVNSFQAYDFSFRGGVSVSALGVGDNGANALATGAGPGGPTQVGVYSVLSQTPTVTFSAYDVEKPPQTGFNVTVTNDKVPPTVIISSPTSGQIFSTNITVQGVAQDDKSGVRTVEAQVDSGEFTPVAFDAAGNFSFTTSLAINSSTTGPHTVTIRVRDKGGNSATANVGFTLDQAPTVISPIANVTVAQDAPPTTINLSQHFADADVVSDDAAGTVIRLDTSFGPIDVRLFEDEAPQSVANFLNYVNSGRYTDTIFHRSVDSSIFVIQGGGFVFPLLDPVDTDAPIPLEVTAKISNTRGTIAMARTGVPNSATSQWFINVQDNLSLDPPDGIPQPGKEGYAVFGEVIGNGMTVVDAIAAVPIEDMGGSFGEIPLVDYTGTDFPTDANRDDFVIVNNATLQPTGGGGGGGVDQLTFSVKSNSNAALVSTVILNGQLTLTYAPGQTGIASITVQALDSFGLSAEITFTVTVG